MSQQLAEAKALVRSLHITLLGVETDAQEALSPFRTERSIRDVKEGLKSARGSVNSLLVKLEEVDAGSEVRVHGT